MNSVNLKRKYIQCVKLIEYIYLVLMMICKLLFLYYNVIISLINWITYSVMM